MTRPLTYQTVVDELLTRVPAFAIARSQDEAYVSHEDRHPYVVFGDFGCFLRKHLAAGGMRAEDALILQCSFGLLDEMLASKDAELINLVQLGVFEGLANTPELLAIAKDYLSDDSNSVLEFWLGKWIAWADGTEEQRLQ